jgi:hypothetical protein
MNPHRRCKNMSIDNYGCFFLMTFSLLAVVISIFVLNPVHKKNIEKLKQDKPLCQQYTLNQSDQIWFYKSDEIGWTKGEVVYLWGYHPVIVSKESNKIFKFHEVEWMVRYE